MSGLKRPPSRMGSTSKVSSAPKPKTKEGANTTTESSEPHGANYVEKLEKILNMFKVVLME
jgi:hypothetical protein